MISNDVSKISDIGNSLILNTNNSIDSKSDVFSDIYNAAINMLDETNKYQLDVEKVQQDFASGKNDDMLTVMMAQEKAYTSLNFTMQVTNKIMESYKEIMRLQL